jgi:hypothetical protein
MFRLSSIFFSSALNERPVAHFPKPGSLIHTFKFLISNSLSKLLSFGFLLRHTFTFIINPAAAQLKGMLQLDSSIKRRECCNMASSSSTDKNAQSQPSPYQQYLADCDSIYDTLVGLCAGRSALLRIRRKRTLKYFQSLATLQEYDGTQAGLPDGDTVGVRVANRSFLHPWKEPNFGITFRYRIVPEDTSLSNSYDTSSSSASQFQHSRVDNMEEQKHHT